ncbi:hypothetical protein HU200_044050 [Digitaria exilis]|uniref:Glycosyltransferase n=1 Tax=Digitaria exilis TaxID=1010633 RepID=A0A835EDA3_9POAL|nr:hypothetical protein HU200_044050 [Digitaria exilis]CAB3492030.1 unnamed protein product [Digitaria exilis]
MDAKGFSPPPPSSSRPLHIVICPWLAFGHMLPYLELADRLASRGHHVTYITTPRNLTRLPPPHHHHHTGGAIDLVALPLPPVDGLPAGAESTNDVPADELPHLWDAFDRLAAPFSDYLAAACSAAGERPDWILADTFHHWAAAAAVDHGVPCALLQPTAAMIAAIACGASDSTELTAGATVYEQMAVVGKPPATMPRYEWEGDAALFVPLGSSELSAAQRCSMALNKSTIAAIRSCPEWELDALATAAKLLGKPLVPLGLLPPSNDGGRGAGAHRDDASVRWLDAQPAKSVVYVALGSEVPLSLELVHELALGLELAGTRFLWALRKPAGVPDDGEVLPAGFRERTKSSGHVAMGWVPQVAVLSHTAVGAFLTHCGRNSLIEGLMYGHPLIMLPIFGDQGPNARLMEGRKVGVQVERDEGDGSFDRHGVARAVKAVMVEEDTKRVFVENAKKMQEIVADTELQERYIDEFVQRLRCYTTADANSSSSV